MSARQRWFALVVLCGAQVMVILDGTIVTVALPAIQDGLRFSPTGLAWVLNAYLVGFGGLLPLAGRLGDLVGRRRVFTLGLLGFVATSLACGLATDAAVLVVARFAQGVAGAFASAVVLGMLTTTFADPRERARAFGAFTFVGAGGASVGTLLGGVLTQGLGWHWIFLINVPIGLVAAALAMRALPAEPGLGVRSGADVPGALLVTAGLMLGVYTIVTVEQHGPLTTAGTGAVAVALLVAFVLRQRAAASPLVPLRIFRSRPVSGAIAVLLTMVAGLYGFQFLTTLYLQQVRGYDAMRTGLAFLPVSLVIAATSLLLSARLIARYGPRRVLLAGLVSIAAGLALFATVPLAAGYPTRILPALVLVGLGFGIGMPALTGFAMSGAAPDDTGLVSGLFNTGQQVGGALGLAVLATVAATRTAALRADGVAAVPARVAGHHLGYLVAAVLVAAGLALAFALLRTPGGADARREETVTAAASTR